MISIMLLLVVVILSMQYSNCYISRMISTKTCMRLYKKLSDNNTDSSTDIQKKKLTKSTSSKSLPSTTKSINPRKKTSDSNDGMGYDTIVEDYDVGDEDVNDDNELKPAKRAPSRFLISEDEKANDLLEEQGLIIEDLLELRDSILISQNMKKKVYTNDDSISDDAYEIKRSEVCYYHCHYHCHYHYH